MSLHAPRFSRLLLILLIIALGACHREPPLPDPSSETYGEAVSAFYTGVAAIQVGEVWRANEQLTRVTELVPQEPAAWANLGVLALRQNAFDEAAERLEKARSLAPDNSQIHFLSGVLAWEQGNVEKAIEHLRQAVALDPGNLRALFTLAQVYEQQGDETAEAEAQHLFEQILDIQPNNLAVQVERARLAAKRNDAPALQESLGRLRDQSADWPREIRDQYEAVQTAANQEDVRSAATQVVFLQNLLKQLPAYRESLAAVTTPEGERGILITQLLRLPSPSPLPAPPDDSLTFAPAPFFTKPPEGSWGWIQPMVLDDTNPPAVVVADHEEVWIEPDVRLSFPGPASPTAPGPESIIGLDYNDDFQIDLAVAGPGGLRLYQNRGERAFVDVTSGLGLPSSITNAPYAGVWAVDLDMEGDIDLVLARPDDAPLILRNNGDGTFTTWPLFEAVHGLRDLAWADLDADGDPDAALLDAAGRLHVFANQRGRRFDVLSEAQQDSVLAVDVTDIDSDGLIDLTTLSTDGTLRRVSFSPAGATWQRATVAQWEDLTPPEAPARVVLFAADLDNNGGLDVVASTPSGSHIWLQATDRTFAPLTTLADTRITAAVDFTGEGRLDLVGLSDEGHPIRLTGTGSKSYHSKVVRPRAAYATGDQRINPFGIGGEIEVRAGLLFQKQPITSPSIHFGLGEHTDIDVVRIIWPNGSVQAEFDLLSDEMVLTQQRLKGSCPWLFTFDGEGMQFVTDFIWRSPLGLRINALETAGITQTEDWVKIRGDQLVPRDGYYDVRITAELWETHFFDHVSLMTVDHPAGTEIFVDERFSFPPPELKVHALSPPKPVAAAWDDQGNDVTDVIQARDGRYLDTFELGSHQGIAREHYVEIELGNDVPMGDSLWLVAFGWLRPTDSSINVAISQGDHPASQGLQLEIPDGQGGWQVVRSDLGFPAGKLKTILIDLTGLFDPDMPRRLRLRTNLEIYWDVLAWATARPEAVLRMQRLAPTTAELRYRGFSVTHEPNRSSPEVPVYDELAGTTQRWRDLIGYYTRFGDVRELLEKIDDRYVIMNAGDELVFRFPVPPPPPEGWVRDFVLIGDGWVKDGDYNTSFSKTVRPLPYHGQKEYTTPPGRLSDDPVYRRFPEDWKTYHTRYVTPDRFQRALTVR